MLARTVSTFLAAIFACVVVLGYVVLFEATRPSPFAMAGVVSWLSIAGFIAGTSMLFAVLVTVLSLPFGFIPYVRSFVPAALIGFLLVAGCLMAVENFSYTLFGTGLKTEQGTYLKVLFLCIAIVLAFALLQLARAFSRARYSRVVGALTVVAALVYYGPMAPTILQSAQARLDGAGLPNILILSTDGLNSEWLSAYGNEAPTTPFLAERVGEFQVFQNAYTASGNTTGSVSALLTGQSPLSSGVVYPPDVFSADRAGKSLPELLGQLGYTRSSWAVPHYADPNAQNIINAFDFVDGRPQAARIDVWLPTHGGLDRWFAGRSLGEMQILLLDALAIQEAENPFDQIVDQGEGLSDWDRLDGVLRDISRDDRFFINTHLMATHGPWYNPRSRYFTSPDESQVERFQEEFRKDSIRDFDAIVATVYERLSELGKLEETILVITSDHGANWDARHRVPLMIRYPNVVRTGLVPDNVSRLDVAPTLLQEIGMDPPSWMDGVSLNGSLEADRVLAAVTVTASEERDGVWVHDGGQVLGSDHLLIVTQCNLAAVSRHPFEEWSFREVGSYPTCEASESAVTDAALEMLGAR